MTKNNKYKELIFTDHAIERMRERNISMGSAWAVWRHPQKKEYANAQGGWVFTRRWQSRKIEVVAKQNDRKQWVIVTVWADPVIHKPFNPWWWRLLKWIGKKVWV